MPNYDFEQDLAIAKRTELDIENKLITKGVDILARSNHNKYDLLCDKDDKSFTVEIKEDFTCKKTGNVGVEYSCRGKPSGIEVSEATFYVYRVHTPIGTKDLIMKTKDLKRLIEQKKYHRTVNGGDPGSNSLNYLFYLRDIEAISKDLDKVVFR